MDGADACEGLEQALTEGLVHRLDGRRIGELCGRQPQNPRLELGGKNPMVGTGDANLELAVEGALFPGFGSAGQRCTSLGRVVAPRTSTTSS